MTFMDPWEVAVLLIGKDREPEEERLWKLLMQYPWAYDSRDGNSRVLTVIAGCEVSR